MFNQLDTTINDINTSKIVAIIRGITLEHTELIIKALIDGGINTIEFAIDQNSPDGVMDTARKIGLANEKYGNVANIGAGTVLTSTQAHEMMHAGAKLIVSPTIDKDIIKICNLNGIVSVPGAMTPTECLTAYHTGANYVKLFPGGTFGKDYVKAIMEPLSHIPYMLVGKIQKDNIAEYLQMGIKCFGIGSAFKFRDAVVTGNYSIITEAAKSLKIEIK